MLLNCFSCCFSKTMDSQELGSTSDKKQTTIQVESLGQFDKNLVEIEKMESKWNTIKKCFYFVPTSLDPEIYKERLNNMWKTLNPKSLDENWNNFIGDKIKNISESNNKFKQFVEEKLGIVSQNQSPSEILEVQNTSTNDIKTNSEQINIQEDYYGFNKIYYLVTQCSSDIDSFIATMVWYLFELDGKEPITLDKLIYSLADDPLLKKIILSKMGIKSNDSVMIEQNVCFMIDISLENLDKLCILIPIDKYYSKQSFEFNRQTYLNKDNINY